jgi:hypothetical protein
VKLVFNGRQVGRTSTFPDSLNPTWMQEFHFDARHLLHVAAKVRTNHKPEAQAEGGPGSG